MSESKSVLDGVGVVEGGDAAQRNAQKATQLLLDVVSSCPKCGAPVYGEKWLFATTRPTVKFSCECRNQLSFQQTVQMK